MARTPCQTLTKEKNIPTEKTEGVWSEMGPWDDVGIFGCTYSGPNLIDRKLVKHIPEAFYHA